MKKIIPLLVLIFTVQMVFAQKVTYKKNIISVDGRDIAKVEVQKENFGLTKNFNLYAMNGEKLIIAVLSTEYEGDKSDNTTMYYRFTFLPTDQVGIFKLATLSQEKGFAKMIGSSGIIENNTLNTKKVSEFIATKGVNPRTAVNYTLVQRNRNWPIELKEDKKIMQGGEEIGFFTPGGNQNGQDHYEFFIPSGVLIAKINFTGDNNAQNFELFTPKDNNRRIISIPQKEEVKKSLSSIDPNILTLKRITDWLVEHKHL